MYCGFWTLFVVSVQAVAPSPTDPELGTRAALLDRRAGQDTHPGFDVAGYVGGAVASCMVGSWVACGAFAGPVVKSKRADRARSRGDYTLEEDVDRLQTASDGLKFTAYLNATGILSWTTLMGFFGAIDYCAPNPSQTESCGSDCVRDESYQLCGLLTGIAGATGGAIALRGLAVGLPSAYKSGRLEAEAQRRAGWTDARFLVADR